MSGRALRDDNHAPRRDTELNAVLREGVGASGREGQPLTIQSSPFTQNRDALIAGMLGPPAWVLRLKQIHDGREQLKASLNAAWAELARRWRGRPEQFDTRWRDHLARVNLAPLNALIKKHNDYYPIEARLPIIYPTGQYHIPFGIEYPQQAVTVERLLDDYPADLDMALYFSER